MNKLLNFLGVIAIIWVQITIMAVAIAVMPYLYKLSIWWLSIFFSWI